MTEIEKVAQRLANLDVNDIGQRVQLVLLQGTILGMIKAGLAERTPDTTLMRKCADAAVDYYLRQGNGSKRDQEIGDEFHDAVMAYKAQAEKAQNP